MEDYSNRVANHFLAKGYKRGDCIALYMDNRPEYIGLWLGLAKIGVISALVNYNLRNKSLVHTLVIGECKAIVYAKEFEDGKRNAQPWAGTFLVKSLDPQCMTYPIWQVAILLRLCTLLFPAIAEIRDEMLSVNKDKFDFFYAVAGSGIEANNNEKCDPVVEGAVFLDDELDRCSSNQEPESVGREIDTLDTIFYIYTSGTTGMPKAVKISHIR